MFAAQRSLALVLAAGLLTGAAACGGQAKPPASAPKQKGTAPAQPAIPTVVAIQNRMTSVATGATSVHVKGKYTWPHGKMTIDVGLLKTGQITGLIVDDGLPMTVIDDGKTMYAKITPAFAAWYHQSAACATLCGKYAVVPKHFAHSVIRSMGVSWTLQMLQYVANDLTKPVTTTYHGQRALEAQAPAYEPGTYVIFTASAYPLKVVYPGHFDLTFSQWNTVPAPHAPPKSNIDRVSL